MKITEDALKEKVISFISKRLKIPKDQITEQTKLQDICFNSIILKHVLSHFEEKLDCYIWDENDDIEKMQTVGDVATHLIHCLSLKKEQVEDPGLYDLYEDDNAYNDYNEERDIKIVILIVAKTLGIPYSNLNLDTKLEDLNCSVADLKIIAIELDAGLLDGSETIRDLL